MAVEQFSNRQQHTLAVGLAASTPGAVDTVTVDSTAGYPTTGQWRMQVDTELLLITGAPTGAAYPCQRGMEGTGAVIHNAGTAVVLNPVTAGSITNIGYTLSSTLGVGTASANLFAYGAGYTVETIYSPTQSAILELATGRADGAAVGIGGIDFDSTAQTGLTLANISVATDGATVGNRGGRLGIWTKANAGALVERIRIDSLGHVGVGVAPGANVGFQVNPALTASGGAAYGIVEDMTITAAANNDVLRGVWLGNTVAKGTFTGLTFYGLQIFSPAATGTGTIANAYGLFVNAPTIGTLNLGARIDGKLGFGADPPAQYATVWNQAVTAASGVAVGIHTAHTLTAVANNDSLYSLVLGGLGSISNDFVHTGTFTGLTYKTVVIQGPGVGAKDGTGTIPNAYALHAIAPGLGTTNYAARFDGLIDVGSSIALGGGAAPTLGTIGGTGPAAAAQNSWLKIAVNGAARYIPLWA